MWSNGYAKIDWRVGCALFGLCCLFSGCASSSPTDTGDDENEKAEEPTSTTTSSEIRTVRDESERKRRERNKVSRVVEKHSDVLNACYLRGLASKGTTGNRGRVLLAWTVQSDGRPTDLRIVENTMAGEAVAKCVAGEVRKMRFPEPSSSSVQVEYPFEFQRGTSKGPKAWYDRAYAEFRKHWSPPDNLESNPSGEGETSEDEVSEKLRELADATLVYVDVAPDGRAESFKFLQRPERDDFVSSVQTALESFEREGEHRWPLPADRRLRKRIASTGLIVHAWFPPKKSDDETKAAKTTSR